jgi:hypothetical protein
MEWLATVGLAIELDKSELMFFQKPQERHPVPRPSSLNLWDPESAREYTVRPVETLRYLGFFLHWRLNWEPHVCIMANCAHASLKALTVLGNSIQGLNMANWRLAFNTICLPVLSYSVQLWLRPGAVRQKKLIDLLQKVQNEGVKLVTGAFRTAPREALLHITCMLPMCFFLEKLTLTSALRLYRLPLVSQLLCRLGPTWHAPRPGDMPLPTPIFSLPPSLVTRCPTALEALAARVPSDGPRVDVTAMAPWEVPFWRDKVKFIGVVNPYTRQAWTKDLHWSMEGLDLAVIHVAAMVSCEGCDDGKMVGGTAAVAIMGSKVGETSRLPDEGLGECVSWSWSYSTDCLQFDVSCFGITKTIEAMTIYFTSSPAPTAIYLFCSDSSALQAVTNPRTKSVQEAALLFHFSLTTFFHLHPSVGLFLVWTPRDETLEPQCMAKDLVVTACQHDPPDGLHKIQSAVFQKDRAQWAAFSAWAAEFNATHNNRPNRRKPGKFAHTHTITRPPDGQQHHPLWTASLHREKGPDRKRSARPNFTRRTTSTALQVAVDHAFTGTYVDRMRPNDPPEARHCPCGASMRSPEHIALHCRRFDWDRLVAHISDQPRPLPFRRLVGPLKKDTLRLLTFIQDSGAFTRPETGPTTHFVYQPP